MDSIDSNNISKYVIYTAIFGDYDVLQELPEKFEGIDFICFTDNINTVSEHWEIIFMPKQEDSSILNRRIKILPHIYVPDYEYSLYIDGNIKINKNPLDIFLNYSKTCTIAVLKHPERKCVYREAEVCIKNSKGNLDKIRSLMEEYKFLGFPVNFGLYEMNVIFRKSQDKQIVALMELWWEEYSKGANRDQISFPYAMWKLNFKSFDILKESPRYSKKYFTITFHESEKKSPFIKRFALYLRLHKHQYKILKRTIDFLEKIYGR